MAAPPKGCPTVSCMSLTKRPAPSLRGRSYGGGEKLRYALHAAVCSVAFLFGWATGPALAGTAAKPVKIVALGDSLTAGLGLPLSEGFVPRLQAGLAAKGQAAAGVNGGVFGGDASAVRARLGVGGAG